MESNKRDKKWELVNFCEFDKYAEQSYCLIHNVDKSLNLGDITKVDETKLEDFNMICGGSPCQDFSISGKQKGSIWTCKDCGHEYNPLTVNYSQRDKCPKCGKQNIEKTRSSLLVEFLRVIREKKPNFGIYENVKNIVGKQFKDTTFKLFEDELDSYGYNSYYRVLNAKNYGIPQSRERVYLIFIKKELDNGQFKFPEGFDNGIRLKDVLEQQVDEKYYLSKDKVDRFLSAVKEDAAKNENKGNKIQQVGNIADKGEGWKNPQAGRVYSTEGCSPTLNTCSGGGHVPKIICCIDRSINKPRQVDYANCLTASGAGSTGLSNRQAEGTAVMEIQGVGLEQNNTAKHRSQIVLDKDRMDLENIRIRKFTPRECFRLMGFGDKCYEKVKGKMSDSQLYKQCGNSIVVDVLYYIFIELYKAMPYLFDDLKVSSYFSGIGAFEAGLDRLYVDINAGKLIKEQNVKDRDESR